MFSLRIQVGVFMKKENNFFIVEKNALPEVFLKVMEVKRLIETGKGKNIQDAVSKVGISRSAFYKYRDSVFPFYENSRGKTVTIGINLEDTRGLLSDVLNILAQEGANILTIHQTIPLNSIANVTITFETGKIVNEISHLLDEIKNLDGVQSLKIIARE